MRPPPHFMKPALRPPFSSPPGRGKEKENPFDQILLYADGREGGREGGSDRSDRQTGQGKTDRPYPIYTQRQYISACLFPRRRKRRRAAAIIVLEEEELNLFYSPPPFFLRRKMWRELGYVGVKATAPCYIPVFAQGRAGATRLFFLA